MSEADKCEWGNNPRGGQEELQEDPAVTGAVGREIQALAGAGNEGLELPRAKVATSEIYWNLQPETLL